MGVRFSHCDAGTRSATTMANMARHLTHSLSSRDWRTIEPFFGPRFPQCADIPPRQAWEIGDILIKAAGHPLMSAEWIDLIREIGHGAKRAAAAGEMWEWR